MLKILLTSLVVLFDFLCEEIKSLGNQKLSSVKSDYISEYVDPQIL